MEGSLKVKKNNDKSQSKQPGLLKSHSNEKENTEDDATATDQDEKATKLKRNCCKRAASPEADDSLADFKLPKLITKPQPFNNKIKLVSDKSSSSTSSRGSKKCQSKRKKSIHASDKNQPSIESSFFKPPTAFVCPLCLKSFNDFNAQSTHSKNCASKNNISTKKLLAAVELQQRQAEERSAIGLPLAPLQQPKRRSSNTKRMSPNGDPDIQLAIALSKSLSELEEREQFDEALVIAAESNENVLQMTLSQRKSTLQNFGFVTNRPNIVTASEKPRRKKNIGTTVLQTRTQEVRERLLSDKIGEILIGTESLTQLQLAQHKSVEGNIFSTISLCSNLLMQIHKPNNDLWNQSFNTKQRSAYYVQDLSEFISPLDDSEVTSDIKNDDVPIVEQPSTDAEIVDELKDVGESNEINPESVEGNSSQTIGMKIERNSLAFSWSKMVNSAPYSDVIINVKNCKYIYSHEVVLWTRCPKITEDLIPNDENSQNRQIKKLQWLDIDFESAIAFLEFIYCGTVNLELLENNPNFLHKVYQLGEKYKVGELLEHLSGKIVNRERNAEDELVHEDKEMSQMTGSEINLYSEKLNSSEDLRCSINPNELNAQMFEERNETLHDREQDSITEICNAHSDAETRLLGDRKLSSNRDGLNEQVVEDKDESIGDKNDEGSEMKMKLPQSTEEINSFSGRESPGDAVESIQQKMGEAPDDSLNRSPNVSCQLHCSRVYTSPDMFADMEMSYDVAASTGREVNMDETHENSNEKALDNLVRLANKDLSSETHEERNIDPELSETPKRSVRLSSTCPDSSSMFKRALDERKNNENLMINQTERKTKSNISLFIEKIQNRNAKDILDSDSDDDMTILGAKKFRRNPFKIRKSNDESLLIGKYHCQDSKRQGKSMSASFDEPKNEEKKSALSLFEDEIRARVAKSSNRFVGSQEKHSDSVDINTIDDEAQEGDEEESDFSSCAETDEEDISMYSKYKRTHRRNSIGNYRSILKSFVRQDVVENNMTNTSGQCDIEDEQEAEMNSDDCDEHDDMKKNTTSKHEISEINKKRLAELSAFDLYEAMSPSLLNSSLDDSSKSKSSSSVHGSINHSALDQVSDDERSDGSTNKFRHVDGVCEDVLDASVNKSHEGSLPECPNNENLDFGSWSEEMSGANDWQPLTQANAPHKSPNRNSQMNQNEQNSLSQLSPNGLESIDLTQSDDDDLNMRSPQKSGLCDTITENITRILKECGVLDSTTLNKTVQSEIIIDNSVPIILSSDSEAEPAVGDVNLPNNPSPSVGNGNFDELPFESDMENNFMGFVMEGGADTTHYTPYSNDIDQPSTSKLCINQRNVTVRLGQSMKPKCDSRQKSIHSMSSNSDDELPKVSQNTPSPKRSRWSSVSPPKTQSYTRSLRTKSQSEGNFTPKTRRSTRNVDRFITPTKQLLSYLNLSADECRISFDIPPRENYSAMSSPELNKRLAEYGLRNQKRHRAVKLLNYVYDQLHPLVPEYLLTSRDKNDSSMIIHQDVVVYGNTLDKAQSESNDEDSDCSSISNSSAIADEMMNLSDEYEEYDEKDVISVRETFQKLLNTDRVLHNKILKYEPIPFETIHEQLKERGVKSGPQILADYLDDECISFYIENPKKRQRQAKQPKMKRKEK